MSVKIENIRELTYDEKQALYGIKYEVKYNVKCINSGKEFEVTITTTYRKHPNIECPCCGREIEFPNGMVLNNHNSNFTWSTFPVSKLFDRHPTKEIDRVSLGLYDPEDQLTK